MAQNNKIPFPLKIKQEIKDIKQEQTTQNTDIAKNKQDIADLDTNKASKAELQEATIALQAELKQAQEEIERQNKDYEAGTLEGQDTGESLYLQDSSDARFREFNIEGNSKQEKRDGYNLIEQKVTSMTGANSEISFDEDGFMTASNSSDKTSYINITADSSRITAGKSYTLKTEFKGEGSAVFLMNSASDYSKNTTASGSLTNTATTSYMNVLIALQSNTTTKVRFTLVEYTDQTAPEYEDYGAMPSLEYSSEIQAVGQDVNMLDTEELVDGYIDDQGRFVTAHTMGEKRTDFIKVKPKTTLTFKIIETEDKNTDWIGIGEYSNANISSFIKRNVAREKNIITLTTSETTEYIIVSARNLQNATKVILKEGNGDMKWSPYNQGSANVVVENKNKLIINANNTELNGIKVTNNFDGTVTINGKATKGTNAILSLRKLNLKIGEKYKISVKPISGTAKLLNLNAWLFRVYANDIDSIPFDGTANNSGTVQITNKKGVAFLWFGFTTTVGAFAEFNNYRVAIQIETGETATDYIVHKEQVFTMPIQKEMLEGDYLDLDNEEEVHTWRKVVLDGVNNKTSYKHDSVLTDTNGFYSIHLPGKSASYNDGNVEAIYCSHLKAKKDVAINAVKENCIWWNGGKSEYVFLSLPFLSISAVNIYLQELYNAGTPVTIYYKLETPTKIPFSEAQKTVVRQIRETLHTYKNGTHVYSVDEISPIFNVKYTKDLNAVINNLSQQAIEGGN